MDRVLNMIIRRVINRLTRMGVDKGVDVMAARRRSDPNADPRVTQQQNKETSQRARQAMKMMRRFGKF
ncbi:hypothetical protein BV394_01065 [Brevirhabdus pacifica]|uniref:Uncharacterized protein n=1 Tax=Brevirhabdus pacifica TaxID=1267768 RepID=A0A1U7DF16_9RHOB|nr:hypothetical protein [Brevirhabdus pacifica]APX88489.1 hypothetical protein BV394_01065 [Brevirhabdus pacifica]OWU79793.1 hypothetical protein ATO5_01765 [Loktanella sp. 22II-4b]PJJ87033.1 hypothetical protein CLV77_1597 [Brevirhabdus pacifica]